MTLDSFDDIEAAFKEAEEKRSQGDLLGAYDSYFAIVSQRLSAQLIDADLVIIYCLADLAIFFGQVQAADDLLTGVAGKYKEVGADHHADFAWLKRIHLALDRGFLRQADELLQTMAPRIGDIRTIQLSQPGLLQWEAGCVWRNADSQERTILFAQLHLAMGRLLCALGQYGDALVTLNRGLFHTVEDAPSLARQTAMPLKLVIATAHLEKGDIAIAKDKLTRLKSELDENQYPEYYIRWLELSGKLNLLCGELGQALDQFKRVQEVCRGIGIGSHPAALRATLNLAHVLISLNQTTFARELLTDAQNDALAVGDPTLARRAKLLLCIANARGQSLAADSPFGDSVSRMRQTREDKAPVFVDEEQEDLFSTAQSNNYLALFEEYVLKFHWQLSRLDLEMGAYLLSQIKEAFQFSDSKIIQVQIKILEGIFAYYQSVESHEQLLPQQIKGLRWTALILNEVRPALQAMELKPELWKVQVILGWCLTRLQHPASEREALATETNTLLDQLTASLSPEDQAIYLLNKWTADEEYIAARINQLQRLKQKLNNGSRLLRPWRRWLLMQHLNALLDHIDRYKDVLVKRTLQGSKLDIKDVPASFLLHRLWSHPEGRVILSFLVLPDRVFVVRAGKFFLDFAVISTTRLELRNTVQLWHETLKRLKNSRDLSDTPDEVLDELPVEATLASVNEVTSHLAEILDISSLLQSLPQNTRSLTIVPDGILHDFPLGTIMHQGKYLIEHYALSITYESSSKRFSTPSHIQLNKALIVGVSQGTSQLRLHPLPGVGREISQVESWLTRRGIKFFALKDYCANKLAILDELLDATFLHIACHGTFKHESPDQSGLILIPNSEQTEILSLRDLSHLDLRGLRHVTLSSCCCADHLILPGRWTISLPETLWRSGVHSILACLWEVDDRVTVPFMTRFYDYVDELPRDEALRRTQLDCLQGSLPNCSSINTANPIFWAGFNLYGDYTTLDILLKKQP